MLVTSNDENRMAVAVARAISASWLAGWLAGGLIWPPVGGPVTSRRLLGGRSAGLVRGVSCDWL